MIPALFLSIYVLIDRRRARVSRVGGTLLRLSRRSSSRTSGRALSAACSRQADEGARRSLPLRRHAFQARLTDSEIRIGLAALDRRPDAADQGINYVDTCPA
jgi:hypothetical protein